MKHLILALIFSVTQLVQPQGNTEVLLFDLELNDGQITLSNYKNISNNEGYDNQPSFLDDKTILYAGTRNGQTDIAKYIIDYDTKIWINNTDGSEYSPLLIPNQQAVSSIRLEKDGTQKLYRYSLKNGESNILIDDIIIGYHVWFKDHLLVSSVLEDVGLSLYLSNINEKENYKIDSNIGRSLHKIPNSELVSYISKQDSTAWKIKSFNPINREIKSITASLSETEDMCWLPNGIILTAKNDIIYSYNPKKNSDWTEVASLKEFGITNITRLTVNSNASKMAIVGEVDKAKSTNKD